MIVISTFRSSMFESLKSDKTLLKREIYNTTNSSLRLDFLSIKKIISLT